MPTDENNQINENIAVLLGEFSEYFISISDKKTFVTLNYLSKILGLNTTKDTIKFLTEQVLPLIDFEKLNTPEDFNTFSLMPPIIQRINNVDNIDNIDITTEDEEKIKDIIIKMARNFGLFIMIRMKKNGEDNESATKFTSFIKTQADDFITQYSYSQNIPIEESNNIVQQILGDIDNVKDSIFPKQLLLNNSKQFPQYFIWKKEESHLIALFDILSKDLNPFIEADYTKFKSLFVVEGIIDDKTTKIKWLRPLNRRQIALLFHTLCDNNYIDIAQKRMINRLIADRLLDNEGKSISKENLKKSYSSLKNVKRKSIDIIEVENILIAFLSSNK